MTKTGGESLRRFDTAGPSSWFPLFTSDMHKAKLQGDDDTRAGWGCKEISALTLIRYGVSKYSYGQQLTGLTG